MIIIITKSDAEFLGGIFQDSLLPIGLPRVRTYIHTYTPYTGKRINSRSGGEEYGTFSGFGYYCMLLPLLDDTSLPSSYHISRLRACRAAVQEEK